MTLSHFAFLCLPLLLFAACETSQGPVANAPPATAQSLDTLKTVKIGEQSISLYVDYGTDSAVLGFSTRSDSVTPGDAIDTDSSESVQYFPLYASTYRGLPAVVLDVFVSKAEDEMWIRSSWVGYETLAHYRLGSGSATTRYGNVAAINTPTPVVLSGSPIAFAKMDENAVTKVATIRQ